MESLKHDLSIASSNDVYNLMDVITWSYRQIMLRIFDIFHVIALFSKSALDRCLLSTNMCYACAIRYYICCTYHSKRCKGIETSQFLFMTQG